MRYEIGEKDKERIAQAFTYHPPKNDQNKRYMEIRGLGKAMAESVLECCPPSRERSLAMTYVEQAIMWANAAIARNE